MGVVLRRSMWRVACDTLESRQLLSAVQTVSTTEVVAEVANRDGQHRLYAFLKKHKTNKLNKLIDVRASDNMYARGKSTSFVEVKLKAGVDPFKAIAALENLYFVRNANPNYLYTLPTGTTGSDFTPNDAQYTNQQHLPQISAPAAWDVTRGDSNLVVAVLDDGLDINHADIAGNVWTNPNEIAGDGIDNDNNGFVDDIHGWNFVGNNNDVTPVYNATYSQYDTHGTLVASIIGAVTNNATGVAGVVHNVKLMPVHFNGTNAPYSSIILANALAYASGNGAKIINISFTWDSMATDPTFLAAVDTVYSRGVLWINSAGNNLQVNPDRQKVDGALFATNVDSTDALYLTSTNTGYGMDIAAPGVNILGLYAGAPARTRSAGARARASAAPSPAVSRR
ncbi:MAG: S8 family serine peptidase [Tepidisphaeraceae bacterium]